MISLLENKYHGRNCLVLQCCLVLNTVLDMHSSLFKECIFANSPTHSKLYVASKSLLAALLWSIMDVCRTMKHFRLPVLMHLPSWGFTKWHFTFLFPFLDNKYLSFLVICLITLLLLVFLCCVLMISLFIIASKCSANVLSGVSEYKKAVVFFYRENTCVT